MSRNLSIKNLYAKQFKSFPFDGLWYRAFGCPESNGVWIIWGQEKNGKTWFALLLADYLSQFKKVLYISAEEGTGMDFVDACRRAKLDPNNANVKFNEYINIEDLRKKLSSRKSADVIFIDNCTVYMDEMKAADFQKLRLDFPEKLFVFLAHEEKKEPYSALAKMTKKFSKVIVHVVGLTGFVSGRCPGGTLTVDENKAQIYWGNEISNHKN
ncbi:MAG TPA: hypothetical protein PKE30_17570 [Niabella sp.]|nr:hypothetical protein [Niabella sp.]